MAPQSRSVKTLLLLGALFVAAMASSATASAVPKRAIFEGTTNSEYSDWGVWVSQLDGSEPVEITSDAVAETWPEIERAALSPDGLEVAYLRYDPPTKKTCIELMSVNGGRSVSIHCGGDPGGLAWSPNGYELAFAAEITGSKGRAVYVMNLKSEELRKVADWLGSQGSPDFSPSGTQIAFETVYNQEEAVEPGIWVVNGNGTGAHQLTNNYESSPAWSPDGSQIAVAAWDEEEINGDEGAIALINSETGKREKWLLNEDGPGEGDPQWSPNGKSLFFNGYHEGQETTGQIKVDGTEERYPFSESFFEMTSFRPQETTGSIEPDLTYLLQRYAPRMHYDMQEQYFADSAAEATDWPENRILASDKSTVLAAHEVGYPTPSLTLLGEAEYSGGYIDEGPESAEAAATLHAESAYANKAYGRVYEDPETGTHWLDYWYYYYYDSQTVAGIGDHEGDWETIALRLNEEDIPDLAIYSRHKEESAACESLAAEWEVTNPSTVSPVAYVANASHANYFGAGEFEREFPRPTDDANGDGAVITPSVLEVESAPSGSLFALPRWFYWDGKWGASGGGGFDQESPSGPARGDNRWEGLEAFAEESEANCEVSGSGAFALRSHTSLPRPAAPKLSGAHESRLGIVMHYETRKGEAAAKYLLLSVTAKDKPDATRTKVVELTSPDGTARMPKPLAPGPYVAAGSTFSAQNERSQTSVVAVKP